MFFLWIIIAIFVVMSIILLSGKGGFLIAGYNTSSAKEKAKYNAVKLSRTAGVGMTVITLTLIPLAILKGNIPSWYMMFMISVISIVVIALLIIMNKIAKKKDGDVSPPSKDELKRNKILRIFAISTTIIVLISSGIFLYLPGYDVEVTDMEVRVNSDILGDDKTVLLDDVVDFEYEKDIDLGKRKFGYGGAKVNMGQFENDKFGNYTLYAYNSCKEYVVLYLEDEVVVINEKTIPETVKIYGEVLPDAGP